MRQTQSAGWALSIAMLLASAPAVAQGGGEPGGGAQGGEDAAAAYDRGAKAFDRGAYREAAEAFARADELAPNPVALESALKSAVLADDPVLGMTLADRVDDRPPSPSLTLARDEARDKLGSRAARATIRCPETKPCTLRLDGKDIEPGVTQWVAVGRHGLGATIEGVTHLHTLEVEAGRQVDFQVPLPASDSPPPAPITVVAPPPLVAPTEPPPTRPDRADDAGGWSPAWFFVGVGLTVASAGATAGVGAYTLSLHDDFQKGDDGAEDPGKNAQTATNVLIGVTGVLAAGTVLAAVMADWDGPGDSDAGWLSAPGSLGFAFAIGPGGAAFSRAW
jgi:hypothetical protein